MLMTVHIGILLKTLEHGFWIIQEKEIPCDILGMFTLVPVNKNFSDEGSLYISVDQTRCDTSVVAKYLDTVTVKKSKKNYKNIFPSGMIFTKYDAYTSDEHVEKLTREFNIHYRACIRLWFIWCLQEWI